MIGIVRAKFLLFLRKPWLFIIMTAICMLFAFFVGNGGGGKTIIPVYSELADKELAPLLETLNESDVFAFERMTKGEVEGKVKDRRVEAGLYLQETEFTILTPAQSTTIPVLSQYVKKTYEETLQKEQLLASLPKEKQKKAESVWKEAATKPLFNFQQQNFRNSESKVIDNQLQGIFGFSLFFVFYTIAYNVIHILDEKRSGIWNRMIVTRVRKSEMYMGNLLYSFIMGYLQVALVFAVFHFGAGVNFHGSFGKTLIILIPYVLAIVSLCMMIAGFSRTVQQYNALIPLVSVSLSMLGGAYWPIEIVSSKIMLALANISPVFYGMSALKNATIYSYSYGELLQSLSILLLMAVVMMGIGINVMERRKTP